MASEESGRDSSPDVVLNPKFQKTIEELLRAVDGLLGEKRTVGKDFRFIKPATVQLTCAILVCQTLERCTVNLIRSMQAPVLTPDQMKVIRNP